MENRIGNTIDTKTKLIFATIAIVIISGLLTTNIIKAYTASNDIEDYDMYGEIINSNDVLINGDLKIDIDGSETLRALIENDSKTNNIVNLFDEMEFEYTVKNSRDTMDTDIYVTYTDNKVSNREQIELLDIRIHDETLYVNTLSLIDFLNHIEYNYEVAVKDVPSKLSIISNGHKYISVDLNKILLGSEIEALKSKPIDTIKAIINNIASNETGQTWFNEDDLVNVINNKDLLDIKKGITKRVKLTNTDETLISIVSRIPDGFYKTLIDKHGKDPDMGYDEAIDLKKSILIDRINKESLNGLLKGNKYTGTIGKLLSRGLYSLTEVNITNIITPNDRVISNEYEIDIDYLNGQVTMKIGGTAQIKDNIATRVDKPDTSFDITNLFTKLY